ncbi:transcriptional regulatory protein SrrA [Clostridium acetireducens DSM 10703]|uniref:Stage 0 sporulation protein A homolog n=1 Tax=Clostridium acetireducens DSM 10703 TaxID=1121290 RepID=A0A1E8F067_9CLOT|nr:response regulator transcription factor [Clostridium acetireducens]OFI06786.1 transcriptional regulatory protein SrrA [Clostridium acetireducens DSM 10703]
MKEKILIIEDEKKLAHVMGLYLKKEGYDVFYAYDGLEGEEFIENNSYDMVILDIMMPKKDGWSLLKKIKSICNDTKVILTTARGEEDDRIFGLELGADDYMVKPLSMRELVLRVNLRIKTKTNNVNNTLIFDNLTINQSNREVLENNKKINLTPKEFELLLFLCKNPNQVFNRSEVLDKIWGYDFMGDTRTVDTHIKNLREKIKFCANHIKTVWGVGYKIDIN